MITYQPATAHSNSIVRSRCLKCGTGMRLFGIEDDSPGYELWSFECPKCHHIQTEIGKSEQLLANTTADAPKDPLKENSRLRRSPPCVMAGKTQRGP